jgi:Carboxypeptidase regulatory-like domain/TonB-dependent Receptor Plug Domain
MTLVLDCAHPDTLIRPADPSFSGGMMTNADKRLVASIAAFVLGFAASAAAQATATIAGTVKDTGGGIVPGATITLISESRGTTIDGLSGATGDFVLTNVPGDTYTVRVTMDGFKTSERKGVAASPGDRVAIGAMTIEVGALAETVVVTGDAPIIQAQTGERSFTVSTEAVANLPTSGRDFLRLVALAPGVVATSSNRPARLDNVGNNSARTNYMLDGVSSVNTGGNQPGLELNSDSIAEVKVLTNAYQAEYGRSSGLQVVGVTKSGSNQFRGSIYDLERDSDWNSNSWQNIRNAVAKPVVKERDWGFTIGGPVGKAGGQNRLFFFFSEQFQPRKTGGAVNRFRVPTLLERQGDFSQTTDNNGNVFNLIRDVSTGLPCTAAETRGCFRDGGVLGRIPQNRLYPLGMNILKIYPEPNTQGLNYNLETVQPESTRNTFQHVIRADYQASSKLRLSAKYAGQNATVQPDFGSIPGFNDRLFKFPALIVPSATVVYTLSSSTILEGTWGYTRGNQLGSVPINTVANRCNVGLCDFPLLHSNAGIVPPGSYQDKVLAGSEAPYYVNGRILLAPNYTWGGRIANPPPNNNYPAFLNWQYTNDVNISLTKLWGSHTFKFGYQSQDSLKVQNLGTITAGSLPVEGNLSFANDTNNPLDTGFGYANAALGVFTSFAQQNEMFEGRYVYHNKDFYVQDNWKVNERLTLDLGMRFVHNGPQYDSKLQSSNFFPDQWSRNSAPLLYLPGCSVNATPCPAANRIAVNPASGTSLGTGSSAAIGTIVPNTGIVANGLIQAGNGIAKENYEEPALALAPRIGAAYDLTGSQAMVLRGAVGLFFDRSQGDSIFGQVGNPPNGQASTVFNSTLQSVAGGTTLIQAPPFISVYNYDSELLSSVHWNAGVQLALPWSSALDVSYVGSRNYNSIAFGAIGRPSGATPGNAPPLDLNAPDLGTAYLPQYQDPTRGTSTVPGASALPENMLRPYRGLGAIVSTWPRFDNQYDSIQTSYNRRFRGGWQGGLNWTLGIRNRGNLQSQPRLEHLADGSFRDRGDQEQIDDLLSNVGVRRHVVKGHFVWDLPDVDRSTGAWKGISMIANDWQVSGVFTGGSGAPYDAVYQYQANGENVNLTGSPAYQARIRVVGDPGSGCSSDQYTQFNVAAFAGPLYGSIGDESGRNLLVGCPDHTTDLSIARNVRLGANRQFQFRVDLFNAFNSVVINARATTLTYASPATPTTITNNQHNADGTLNAARLRPVSAGAGAATGAQALRTIQLQFRFMF